MSWLRSATEVPTPFEGVLGLRPELLSLYRDLYGKLWADPLVPPALLELCRLRIASWHDCEAERGIRHATAGVTAAQIVALDDWHTADCFTACERAALTIADKMCGQVHDVSDEDVAAVRQHLSDAQTVALMLALGLFDAQCRVRLALGVVPKPVTVDAPASAHGMIY
ncbi:MAG: carboxymuconolactone decarboxylase family protein [Deltaproteobacteria bacterium]|nr:carboxymuconolactone decarboxylase family protein [Deltaproteobacteria bacterium]MBI3389905.1 carboxymuconolactone decarboxylase family protein [Deltaproteobacteria bacterium]